VRRIILMVGLALLMATFVVVSALPAIAAPPDVDYSCVDENGNVLFHVGAGEVPRRDERLFLERACRDRGGVDVILTVARDPDNRNPGKPDDTPPCCAGRP
jgi:hypothetical protein